MWVGRKLLTFVDTIAAENIAAFVFDGENMEDCDFLNRNDAVQPCM